MPAWIAWLISGISTAGFVAIWFATAHRELSRGRGNVENAVRQIKLHADAYPQVRDGPYGEAAMSAADTSRMIYRETVKGYNRIRRRTMNRIPALILGYPHIGEEVEPFADAFSVRKTCTDAVDTQKAE